MKKFFKITPLFILILFYSCNTTDLDNGEEINVNTLIPKRVTFTNPVIDTDWHMNFNEEGYPEVYTNEDNSISFDEFIYDNNQLTDFFNYDSNHSVRYYFYYEDNKLDSIFCNCHNGVTSDQRTWSISYNGNQITSNVTTQNFNRTNIYTFETNQYQVLTEIENFNDSNSTNGSGLSKFYYDDNGNPIKLERYSYNEDLLDYELNTIEAQTFDDANNFYKNANTFHPVIEQLYTLIGTSYSSRLRFLNRKATNNVISRKETFVPQDVVLTDLSFQYIYNSDNYPISFERTNFGNELREYAIEYY